MTTAAVIDPQAFAAPQRAVLSVPQPIQRQADNRSAFQWPMVFGQAGGQMRMMVQHRGHRQPLSGGPLVADVTRMSVAG
ncbi:hypothetical protein D3C76_1607490 [compost metagenome]